MQKLTILNTRDVKEIKKQLVAQFGYAPEENYAYLKNEKDRLFIVNREVAQLDLDKLHIDRLGLYFAEVRPGYIRLSKEGAQLLVHEAKKKDAEVKNPNHSRAAGHSLPEAVGFLLPEMGIESRSGAAGYKTHFSGLKNAVLLSKIEARAYFAGVDLKKDLGNENRLILVIYEEDVLGCASYKEGKILNFLPKTHRGEIIL